MERDVVTRQNYDYVLCFFCFCFADRENDSKAKKRKKGCHDTNQKYPLSCWCCSERVGGRGWTTKKGCQNEPVFKFVWTACSKYFVKATCHSLFFPFSSTSMVEIVILMPNYSIYQYVQLNCFDWVSLYVWRAILVNTSTPAQTHAISASVSQKAACKNKSQPINSACTITLDTVLLLVRKYCTARIVCKANRWPTKSSNKWKSKIWCHE